MTIPALAGGIVGTKYDWNTTYTANPNLNDRVVSIPQGKIVGGSTKVNRMVFDRGSEADFNRWEELGNEGWNWDSMFAYMKKVRLLPCHRRMRLPGLTFDHLQSEIFTPPSDDIVAEWGVEYDPSFHGTTGNIQTSYSRFFWPLTRVIIDAVKELALPTVKDQGGGTPIGGYFCPHNINPSNSTRSSAREAYYNVVESRSNLHLIPGQQVTKLITSTNGTVSVTAVEYAASATADRMTVGVTKEAILAAGSLHSPQILQVSGIGAPSLLESIGVATVVDLPAVGENFQDHTSLSVVNTITTSLIQSANLTNNATFAAEAMAQYEADGTGPYSSPTADYLVFLPLTSFTNNSAAIAATAAATNGTSYLPADTPAEVAAGYAKEQAILDSHLLSNASGLLEVIWDSGTMVLGLQHPYSRGSVRAASGSTFDAPAASPGYLSNPVDLALMVEAVGFARALAATAAVRALRPVEASPAADVDVEAFVRAALATLYHPAGSCKMAPRADGGVVDARLRVYGVANLRVVDASVMPLLPATHIMTAVFGVAEKAADLIRGVASV